MTVDDGTPDPVLVEQIRASIVRGGLIVAGSATREAGGTLCVTNTEPPTMQSAPSTVWPPLA